MKPKSTKFADWVVQDMAITGREQRDAIAMRTMETLHESIVTDITKLFYSKTSSLHPIEARKIASKLSESFAIASRIDPEEDREWETPHVKPEKKAKALERAMR